MAVDVAHLRPSVVKNFIPLAFDEGDDENTVRAAG